MQKMEDEEIRFECLKLALENTIVGKNIIETAQHFYNFVKNNVFAELVS